MSQIVLFDFDCTLTKTDTVKFILLSSLFVDPLLTIHFFRIFAAFFFRKTSYNALKNALISSALKEKDKKAFNRISAWYTCFVKKVIRKEVFDILMKHCELGDIVAIVTASPTDLIRSFFIKNDFTVIGTDYEKKDGVFNGRIIEPECIGDGKVTKIKMWMEQNGFDKIDTAYSDSLADIPMLKLAENAFIVSKNSGIQKLSLD